ncbi:MAG TPA: hypothetical protein VEW26_06735 [Allosphingosinicella sp.]|nr:hypothetical protein [Allosphingosinicella sp.]
MTGSEPVLNRPALWAALSHMRIELSGAPLRFEDSLADEQGWTVGFAERVTDEYRRFLYLAATAGFEVTPSQAVDEAWHLHLTLPHYREILCGRILGRPLEHRPATGESGDEERHCRQYEDTVALYERAFLRPPPSDIWPRPISWESRLAAAGRRRGRGLAFRIAGGAALGAAATYASGFAVASVVLGGAALIFGLLALPWHRSEARSRDGSGACGGGCGGAGSHDGGGCGASCGGGCGGD